MQTTINAQTIINTVTAAAAIAPEFNESERVQNEFHHSARYMRVYFDDETPPAVTNAARAEAYSEFLRCNPTPPPKIKIQTSARGYMTIQNTRERLEQLAATVRRNAAAFGGGLLKIAKPRAAITWPAGAVKMVRELIQDHDYAGALDLAGAKCGAMFYQHQKAAFMLLAPVECAEIPGMMSAQNEKGHFVVFEPVSGFEIAGAYGSKDKTRAAAIAGALAKWNASTNQVAAIEKAHATPCDQQAARLAWMTEHGIQHQEEITARIEAAAAQDVAQVIEAATIAASTATEAQPWHTTSQTRELVTACEGTDYTTQRETLGELHDTPQVIEPATAKRMAGEVAQNAPKTAETTPTAPVDVKNLIEAGYPSTVAEIIAKSGIDAYGPMAQAEILEKLATAKHSQDAPTRYRFKPGVMVQKINSKSGKWMAEFRLTPIGRFELGFKVGSGCSLSTTYATASKRMQALQAMAREADTPTPPTTYDAPPATTGTTEEADYTTARETSRGAGLHHTPQDLAPHNDLMSFFMPTDKKSTSPQPGQMTGAELQTLRESCNLSREDFAGLAGVQSRTVKHWESGRAGVPADVAHLVNTIDSAINAAADQARAHLEQLTRQNDQAPADIVLIRYRSNEDLHQYRPDMQAMPACVHGAIVNRMRQAARAKGIPARVVWMEPEQYNPWRAACHLPDTESTRAAWAAQQVDAQAMPHRGDQPPA